MSGLVWMTGKCPHCDLRKHQAGTEEYAAQVLDEAFKKHIAEAHATALATALAIADNAAAETLAKLRGES